jgi:putative FmdB family regulatory protein
MPIYEYRCKACEHEFEALVLPHKPETAPECPECHSKDLEKLLSGFAPSSDGIRQANALKSRQQQVAKRKDAIVAEEEHRLHHDD